MTRPLRPHLTLLPAGEADRLHQRSLDLLWQPGIQFNCREALDVLEQHGCPVDRDRLVAQIPARLVEEALQTVPRVVRLAGRSPANDLILDGGDIHFTLDSQGSQAIVPETGELRGSTGADLGRAMRLADALPEAEILNVTVAAQDVPAPVRVPHQFAIAWANTGKHIRGGVLEPAQVPFLMAMAEAVSGGQAVTERGAIFSVVDCTVSPLQHHATMTPASMALAERGIPILVYPMPLAGATGPLTPAGAALMANTEFLSSLVLYQCLKPGAPLIYGVGAAEMNMRTGLYQHGPTSNLCALMLAGMARRYHVPLNMGGLGSAAMHLGPQCGWEGTMDAALSALAGCDELYAMGLLGSAQILCLEKMVYDAEQARQLKRLFRGLTFDDDHLLAGLIERVGIGGHFLAEPETRDLMRAEVYVRELRDERSQAEWQASGRDETAQLSEIVTHLLATHQPPPWPAGAEAAVGRLLEEAARALGEQEAPR